MRVIDARSGEEMVIGKTVSYHDGERLTLVDLDEGLLSANAFIESVTRDFQTGRLVTRRQQIPLLVRLFHPSFLFQRVAFIPS
jgi:hypothetical protein